MGLYGKNDSSQYQAGGFMPALVKVEVSADQVSQGEALWVTSWWKNEGGRPSQRPFFGFMEMELGHQRSIETAATAYRITWSPYPGTNQWMGGDIWKTTCRWNVRPEWCGSFKIFIGLCDEHSVPVMILTSSGKMYPRVYVGEVQVGWGYGQPTVELERKAWSVVPDATTGTDDLEIPTLQKLSSTQDEKNPNEKAETIVIGKEIKVRLRKEIPAITEIRDEFTNLHLYGKTPEILLRRRDEDRLIFGSECGIHQYWQACEKEGTQVEYTCSIYNSGIRVGHYTLQFKSEGRGLRVTLENVVEAEGYELLEVRLPALLSADAKNLSIAEFYGGGRLIPAEKVPPIAYTHSYDVRNAAAMFNHQTILVIESSCLDDRLLVAIKETTSGKWADLGIAFVHRVRAKGALESIKVLSIHPVSIHMLDKTWGIPSWQAAARFLRKDLKPGRHDIYRRALVYKHLSTYGPQPKPGQVKEDSPRAVKQLTWFKKFSQILDETRQYFNIFDGIPQVVYIAGFQKDGFDTCYPFVYDTDPRAGTVEELRTCIREAVRYNAVVGLHDNYDSCVSGPYFDPEIVCIDEEGGFWKGWIWAGGLDYIVSPNKYKKSGKMRQRVEKTVAMYGLHTSSHIDVLSSELLRYDFDPENPSSADSSIEGKFAIIEEYNRLGIDITSETLQHPFIGRLGYALWTRDNRKDTLFPGEKYIPLTYMVYHGTIGYCGPGGSKTEMLWSLVRGSFYFWEENHTDPTHIQWIYLQNLPLGMLHDKVMQEVVEEGEVIRVDYGNQSYVWVDFEKQSYRVVVDGNLVAADWTTFVPGFRKGSYLAYSLEGGEFRYPVPLIFGPAEKLNAVVLTFEGEGEKIPCAVENGQVKMNIPAKKPVRITSG